MASINDRSSRWSIAARLHPSSREPWSVDREKIIWTIVPLVSIQISMVDGNRNSSFDQFQNSTAVFTLCNRIPIPYQIPRCHAIRPRVPALPTSWKFTAGRSVYPDYVLINKWRRASPPFFKNWPHVVYSIQALLREAPTKGQEGRAKGLNWLAREVAAIFF